jgi:hypothetical protein
VSFDDFASIIVALVGMEVPEVPDEKMVDYEAILKKGEINVVVLSTDYYIVADDSTVTEFNFAMESVVFQKPDDSINHLKPLHVKGQINGTLVHSMLVDSGAIVCSFAALYSLLFCYSFFLRTCRRDAYICVKNTENW